MKLTRLLAAVLLTSVACASGSSSGDLPATGGSTGTGGALPPATGGATSATGGSTGGATGGSTGSTGGATTATGGRSGGAGPGGGKGGTSSGSGGAGGSGSAAGMTGTGGGSAGGSGTTRTVKPSAGCSRGSTQVTIPNSLIGMPPGYNGKDPVPAVIAFHAAGNDNTSMERAFKSSDLAKKYFMVYPNSSGNGWNISSDKSRYLDAHAALLSQACVDENRVYATGHSSGAQMIVQLLCNGEGDFDAVAPVASSVYCSKWKKGAIPALIIHGVQDTEREAYGLKDGNGAKDLQPYLTSNMCSMTSTPFDPVLTNCTNVKNGIDSKPFNDGCVEFSGCGAKTRWCNHNDPQYGTSNHGIPCFGVRAIYDFFESL